MHFIVHIVYAQYLNANTLSGCFRRVAHSNRFFFGNQQHSDGQAVANDLMVDSDQRSRVVQNRRRMVHDCRVRHHRHDGLDQRHRVHERSVVHDRGMVHNGVGDHLVRDQLGGGMVDDVPAQ